MDDTVRIDKWLWAVRIFKTRTMAADSCKGGKVRIHDTAVKPSREIKSGDIVSIAFPPMLKTVRVIVPIEHRVSAKQVVEFCEDLTPKEEYEKLQIKKEIKFGYRLRGMGRPTKRDRRDIEILKRFLGE